MKRRIMPLVLSAYFVLFIIFVVLLAYFWNRDSKTPVQPINFSHQIHVSKVGLQCTFCHDKVDKSTFAGIPPVQKCMSCHKNVKTESPEIQKLTRYWEEKKPVPWKRVYSFKIQNYVYFSHKRHIKAGLDCSKCHGEVKLMPQMKRVRQLEMGWCVSCHKANMAPTDCVTCHK
ncbi:MAG: cytochrome c3 family protein [Calditrichia bacterium]